MGLKRQRYEKTVGKWRGKRRMSAGECGLEIIGRSEVKRKAGTWNKSSETREREGEKCGGLS